MRPALPLALSALPLTLPPPHSWTRSHHDGWLQRPGRKLCTEQNLGSPHSRTFALQNITNVFCHVESIYAAPIQCPATAEPFLTHSLLIYPLSPLCMFLLPTLSSGHPKFLQPHAFSSTCNALHYLVYLENSYPDFKTLAHKYLFWKAIPEPQGFLYGQSLSKLSLHLYYTAATCPHQTRNSLTLRTIPCSSLDSQG